MDEGGVVAERGIGVGSGKEKIGSETAVDRAVNFICPDPNSVEKGVDKLKEMAAAAPELAVQLWAVYRLADYALGLKTGSYKEYPVMRWGVMRLGAWGLPFARRPIEVERDGVVNKRYDLGENPLLSGEMDYLFESTGRRLKQFKKKMVQKATELYGQRQEVGEVMGRIADGATRLGLDGISEKDLVCAYYYFQFKERQKKDSELKDSMKPFPLGMDDARRVQMEIVVDRLLKRNGGGSKSG